jgi:HEAT repeat protein
MLTLPQVLLVGLGVLTGAGEPAASDPGPRGPDLALLEEMLRDKQHPRGQCQAALLLMQSPAAEAERIVRQGLRRTEEPEVFAALAAAAHLCQDTRFQKELLAGLASRRPMVRQAAAQALAVLLDDRLLKQLQALAEDANQELPVRQMALWTLGRCGRKPAVATLVRCLRSEQDALRQTATEVLTELTGQSFGAVTQLWETWWERHSRLSESAWLEQRLVYQSTRARRLESDLARAQAQVLRLEQQLYSRLPHAERLGHIQTLVEQEDPAVRLLAVQWALELLGAPESARQQALVETLLRLSSDPSLEVQRAAVLALGRVGDPAAFSRLQALLRRGDAPVRAAAARALAQHARADTAEAPERRKAVVPLLQKTLDDPELEVVVEAAEDLGALGVPEAGPVLVGLLQHPSEHVRQTAAQALERVADAAVLPRLLALKDDASVTVRFSLLGALARAAGNGTGLSEEQRQQVLQKLETALRRDADPGVRSRAATVLGECGNSAVLPPLWKCVRGSEDGRVQEKAWAAMIEVLVRAQDLTLLQEWDRALTAAGQGQRRVQLLSEVSGRWGKRQEPGTRVPDALALAAQELLIQAQLAAGKRAAALPLIRELLARPAGETEINRRLQWFLTAAEQALKDGATDEVLRLVQEAQPYLPRAGELPDAFARLARDAGQKP